ncbi:hypothetical protein [Hymenobacter latericus]|nr:hypothetical protein [Hymenobacter sp. YIM 151858-1]UYZ61139.1 hypothetical protein OIS50_19410 [Hymenobacter sp. YIM 151858-1]
MVELEATILVQRAQRQFHAAARSAGFSLIVVFGLPKGRNAHARTGKCG